MIGDGIITKKEAKLLESVMADKALMAPAVAKDALRAGMMRALATGLLSGGRDKENKGE